MILPKESESQEIGRNAGRAFTSKLPNSWIEKDQSGDTDFGLDYMVQLKDKDSYLTVSFYLQLKGTKTPKYVNKKKEISQKFNCSTLNYYRKNEPAVMVAVVDLSASDRPADCPVYYRWLDEDFLDSISDKLNKNETVAVKIPVAAILDESLDIFPYYKSRLEKRDSLINLHRAVNQYSQHPISEIEGLTKVIWEKPILLEVSKDDSGTPWLSNPEDHIAGKLHQVHKAISSNMLDNAQKLIEDIESEECFTAHESAELLYLKGTLLSLKGENSSASILMEKSFNKFANSRYKVGFYQSAFQEGIVPNVEILEKFVENLDSAVFDECLLKAKCLTLLGKEKAAMRELDKFPSDKTVVAKLVNQMISGDFEKFDKFANEVVFEELNDRQKLVFHILIGRRYFYKGINYDGQWSVEVVIPARGKREFDFKLLSKALDQIKQAFDLAKNQGYPNVTYMLLDVAPLLFGFFESEDELISIIEDILSGRPDSLPVISTLVLLKFNTQRYKEAIQLLDLIADKTPEQISLLIAANYHSGYKSRALELIDEHKELLLEAKPQNYDVLFCVAALCAYETLKSTKEKDYLEVVQQFENGEVLVSIYDYLKSCSENPQKRRSNSLMLYKRFVSLGKPPEIAQQLFPYLEVNEHEEATIICDLAKSLSSVRKLYPEENVTYAFALANRERWQELLILCEKIESIQQLDNLWSLLKATALDGLGRSGEALDILDSSVECETRSIERAENFANLCVRLGFFAKATEKLESLFEKSDSAKKLSILESLMFLYSADVEPSDRLIPALLRYGQLVDQDDEIAEGRYLTSFLIMTNRSDTDVAEYAEDFRTRLSNYTEKFPNSSVLKKGEVPLDGNQNEVLQEFRRLAGITEKQVERWKKNRNLIRTRKLPVPFAMLQNFLGDVNDIFSAWVLNKYCGRDKREIQLIHARMASEAELDQVDFEHGQLVLDETCLLTLNDLGLLQTLLKTLNGIVLSKVTYANFAQASHAVMGSINYQVSKKIVDELGLHIDKVTLKGGSQPASSCIEQYERLLNELTTGILCTEDRNLAEFIRLSGFKTLNSTNIVDLLYKLGALTSEERIRAIEKLCSLGFAHTDIKIEHVVDSLSLNRLSEAGKSIMESRFKVVFDAVFHEERSANDAINLLCKLFAVYLNQHHCDIELDGLDELLNIWMVRNPVSSRLEMVSIWFVFSCHDTRYVPESSMNTRGKGQARLWGLVEELTINRDREIDVQTVLSNISDVVLRLDPESASSVFEKIQYSFTPGSREAEMFSQIYSRKAIEHRLAEVSK